MKILCKSSVIDDYCCTIADITMMLNNVFVLYDVQILVENCLHIYSVNNILVDNYA